MINTQQLEDLAAKLAGVIPPGLKGLRAELQDNFRAVLRANLEKLDQAELLARTQAKLAALEKRLKKLEQDRAAS
jgi:ubiquinone biosynthesis accessory factor UbiK